MPFHDLSDWCVAGGLKANRAAEQRDGSTEHKVRHKADH